LINGVRAFAQLIPAALSFLSGHWSIVSFAYNAPVFSLITAPVVKSISAHNLNILEETLKLS